MSCPYKKVIFIKVRNCVFYMNFIKTFNLYIYLLLSPFCIYFCILFIYFIYAISSLLFKSFIYSRNVELHLLGACNRMYRLVQRLYKHYLNVRRRQWSGGNGAVIEWSGCKGFGISWDLLSILLLEIRKVS